MRNTKVLISQDHFHLYYCVIGVEFVWGIEKEWNLGENAMTVEQELEVEASGGCSPACNHLQWIASCPTIREYVTAS